MLPNSEDQALECLSLVTASHPSIGEAWQKLGDAASAKNDINRAIEAYKKSIELVEGEGNR